MIDMRLRTAQESLPAAWLEKPLTSNLQGGIWLSFPALTISQKQLSSLPEVSDKRSEWSRNTDFKESLILPPSFVH